MRLWWKSKEVKEVKSTWQIRCRDASSCTNREWDGPHKWIFSVIRLYSLKASFSVLAPCTHWGKWDSVHCRMWMPCSICNLFPVDTFANPNTKTTSYAIQQGLQITPDGPWRAKLSPCGEQLPWIFFFSVTILWKMFLKYDGHILDLSCTCPRIVR